MLAVNVALAAGDNPKSGEPRAEALAGETNRVEIDAKQTGAEISPLLFGHNLEHTRRAIWQGISAEMIANRKFAAVDNGLPKRWTITAGGGRVLTDDQVTYAGKHSVRLENGGGIEQHHAWLAFRKGAKYGFRIWTKSKTKQSLRLRVTDAGKARIIFEKQLVSKSGDWQLLSGEFVASATETNAWAEFGSETAGALWIGAVSLMPADNFHGMRRDVVDLLKTLKPGCLRWPGGCFAEYYVWEDGLLPVDQRPPLGPAQWEGLLPETDGYDNHEIGIDEYNALCRELNCAPVITIRYGQGSPKEAAAWVEYCNGGPETRWGKVRADRGHSEAYRVKYWFVGNEIWGISLVKNKDPKVCAVISRQFAEAMKKADPSIELIGCAPTHDPALLPVWLAPLLAEAGDLLAMVQNGWYFPDHDKMKMAEVAKASTQEVLPLLKSLRQFADRTGLGGKRMGIAFYEWNVDWGRPGDVISGVFAAGMLNMFCREAESLGLVFTGYFQPVTEGAIKVDPLTSELEPDGQVFTLYVAHQGNRLLKTSTMADDADLDLCASLTPDGKSIYVTVVNRNTTSDRTLELSLRNFAVPAEAAVKLLVPLTVEVKGKFVQHDEQLPVIDGHKVMLKLPPCGIARMRFGKLAAKADGVKSLGMENGAAVYAVGSGTYRFQSTLPDAAK
jgi:alpha-N-arabinofuranosidase